MTYLGSRDDFMGNYPPGAAHDPRAPWNQEDLPEVQVDRKFMVDLEKVVTITTDDYIPDGDDYYGMEPDFSDTDFNKEFETQYHSIPQLLAILKEYIEKDMENLPERSHKRKQLKELADECDGWVVTNVDNDEP